jgi:hypothetical protein
MNRKVNQTFGVAAVAAVIFLAVTIVLAQGPGPAKGMRNYDSNAEITAKGTVEEVLQVQGKGSWGGMHVILKAETENLEVHLGPSSYISQKQFSFAKGDQIEVLGSKVKLGTKDVLIAREVTKDGRTLVLRNSQGIPVWSGRRRAD